MQKRKQISIAEHNKELKIAKEQEKQQKQNEKV